MFATLSFTPDNSNGELWYEMLLSLYIIQAEHTYCKQIMFLFVDRKVHTTGI